MGSLTNQWSESIQQNQRYCHLYSTHSSFFSKPGAYITHNAVKWHHWRQVIRWNAIWSRHTKGCTLLFFNMQYAVFLKTCQHTQMCKIAGVTFLRLLISCFPLQEKKNLYQLSAFSWIFSQDSHCMIKSHISLSIAEANCFSLEVYGQRTVFVSGSQRPCLQSCLLKPCMMLAYTASF